MGVLYIVATPIGNLEDITIRAIRVLLAVPVVACEDTRRTGILIKLLRERYSKYLTSNPSPNLGDGNQRGEVLQHLISVRDWNEAEVKDKVLEELEHNDVALVSDAGTPLISDPGFKVVRAARTAGFEVSPIPGPSAAIAALSVSGLPTNKFTFLGFLPKKWEIRPAETTIIYESPQRTLKTLKTLKTRYPDAQIVVASEMTKIHESFNTFNSANADIKPIKGEVTILVYVPHNSIDSAT